MDVGELDERAPIIDYLLNKFDKSTNCSYTLQ